MTDIWTDRQTDGQNYDSQDRASIAASRGKNPGYGPGDQLQLRPCTVAVNPAPQQRGAAQIAPEILDLFRYDPTVHPVPHKSKTSRRFGDHLVEQLFGVFRLVASAAVVCVPPEQAGFMSDQALGSNRVPTNLGTPRTFQKAVFRFFLTFWFIAVHRYSHGRASLKSEK